MRQLTTNGHYTIVEGLLAYTELPPVHIQLVERTFVVVLVDRQDVLKACSQHRQVLARCPPTSKKNDPLSRVGMECWVIDLWLPSR